MSGARIVAGDFDADRLKISALKRKILRVRKDKEFKERQFQIDQRRVPKQISRTRFILDFSIGQVVKHWIVRETQKQIEIDLQPFYKVVGDRSEKEIDRALMEFFTTGVVGTLVRANQHLIEINPNRKKVFMGTVRKLHDLLFLGRELDKLADEIAKTEAERNRLIDNLSNQTSAVYVQGVILPNIDLQFVLPDVAWSDEGEAAIGMQTPKLVLQRGADPYKWEVQLVDINDRASVRSINPEDLEGVAFRVNEGWVDWT